VWLNEATTAHPIVSWSQVGAKTRRPSIAPQCRSRRQWRAHTELVHLHHPVLCCIARWAMVEEEAASALAPRAAISHNRGPNLLRPLVTTLGPWWRGTLAPACWTPVPSSAPVAPPSMTDRSGSPCGVHVPASGCCVGCVRVWWRRCLALPRAVCAARRRWVRLRQGTLWWTQACCWH
jgi:hypothetical protein